MTCPNCGAAPHLDRGKGVFVCDFCGTEAVPPPGDDGVQVLAETSWCCPSCSGALSAGLLESHELLYCVACRGMLIAMGRFVAIIDSLRVYRERSPLSLPPPDHFCATPARKCPLCSAAMECHSYAGPGNFMLNSCEPCEVNWLDPGELQRVAAAYDADMSPRRPGAPVYSNYGDAGERDD